MYRWSWRSVWRSRELEPGYVNLSRDLCPKVRRHTQGQQNVLRFRIRAAFRAQISCKCFYAGVVAVEIRVARDAYQDLQIMVVLLKITRDLLLRAGQEHADSVVAHCFQASRPRIVLLLSSCASLATGWFSRTVPADESLNDVTTRGCIMQRQ
jgi:hypothetical protein